MEDFDISGSDLVLKERIGSDSFDVVHHVDWQGLDVAIKIFMDQDFHPKQLKEFLRGHNYEMPVASKYYYFHGRLEVSKSFG